MDSFYWKFSKKIFKHALRIMQMW